MKDVLCLAAFACFMASSLLIRHSDAPDALFVHYMSRVVEIVVCLLVALLARRQVRVDGYLMLVGVLAFLINCLNTALRAPLLSDNTYLALGSFALSGFFDGTCTACIILLFARAVCALPPKLFSCACPLAIAGSHALFLLSGQLPLSPIVEKLLFQGLGILGLVLSGGVCAGPFCKGAPAGPSGPALADGPDAPAAKASVLQSLPTNNLYAIAIGAVIFPFFYGLIAEACSMAGVSKGLFGVPTEVVAIAVLILMALFFYAAGHFDRLQTIDGELVFICIFQFYATALLFFPLFWGQEVFVSGFIIKVGFVAFWALLWVFLHRGVVSSRQNPYFVFGVLLGVYHLTLMLGRLCASIASVRIFGSSESMTIASLVAIWVLSIVSTLVMVVRRRRYARTAEAGPTGANGSADTVVRGTFEESCRFFSAASGLSQRESDICHDFARGCTVEHIAEQLGLSRETVKTYLKRIYGKTGCHSRQDLIDAIEASGASLGQGSQMPAD